nr:unnamed protein product [Callosobruchus chinensis]
MEVECLLGDDKVVKSVCTAAELVLVVYMVPEYLEVYKVVNGRRCWYRKWYTWSRVHIASWPRWRLCWRRSILSGSRWRSVRCWSRWWRSIRCWSAWRWSPVGLDGGCVGGGRYGAGVDGGLYGAGVEGGGL